MMSSRPRSASACFSAGTQGEVAGGQRVHADDVHVGVDRLLGDLLRRGEQRADVDVEAQVGERGDDDLLAAVVPVLAHLRDQDPRAGGPRPPRTSSVAASTFGASTSLSPPASPGTPRRWYGSRRWCRPKTFSSASEISPTVALARAASTASASRLPSQSRSPSWCRRARRTPVSASRVRADLVGVPLRAELLELGELLLVDARVVDLEHVERSSVVQPVGVHADQLLRAGVDPRLGAGRRLLDPHLRDALPRSPSPSRRPPRPPGCAPRPARRGRG